MKSDPAADRRTTKNFRVKLGVKRSVSRLNDIRAKDANEEFEKIRPSILRRDDYTCQGCGYRSRPIVLNDGKMSYPSGFLEVHHIDDDHTNNNPSNLVTLCPYCHMPFTFGYRGGVLSGSLIYAPDISQEEINLIWHCVTEIGRLISIADGGFSDSRFSNYAGKLKRWSGSEILEELQDALSFISTALDEYIYAGEKVFLNEYSEYSEIDNVVAVLKTLPDKDYERRGNIFGDFRMIPKESEFENMIEILAVHNWGIHYSPESVLGICNTMISHINRQGRKRRPSSKK